MGKTHKSYKYGCLINKKMTYTISVLCFLPAHQVFCSASLIGLNTALGRFGTRVFEKRLK